MLSRITARKLRARGTCLIITHPRGAQSFAAENRNSLEDFDFTRRNFMEAQRAYLLRVVKNFVRPAA
jgi:hypothetical protein